MIFICRPQTDPFFNLAAEEFLLKNKTDDILMLWQSHPSVIVGKHQNTLAEVNIDYARENHIAVIRRISGGGTVYHDQGNINISLMTTVSKNKNLIDFKSFTRPIRDFLHQFELKTAFEGKNNLTINGKKFSGNSAHVFKNSVLHHGTLLYQTDLEKLEKVTRPNSKNIADKSIKSIRAHVTNIADFLSHPPSTDRFREDLKQFLKRHYSIHTERPLSKAEEQAIEKLATEKYKNWQWTFGYSPRYRIRQQYQTVYGTFQVDLEVNDGLIRQITLLFENKRLEKIEQKLLGKRHSKETLLPLLKGNRFSETIIETLF